MLSENELEKLIDELTKENKSLVEKSGENAFGTLMGLVMKKVRGKANAETVARALKEKLKKS